MISIRTKYKKIYTKWIGMRQRCNNPKRDGYKYYGGRGIRVSKKFDKFEDFLEWALKSGYKDGLTIERINVNGDYCPENCEWATLKDQARNRRNNVYIEINGVTKLQQQWFDESPIDDRTIFNRIHRQGWDILDALTRPANKYTRKVKKK